MAAVVGSLLLELLADEEGLKKTFAAAGVDLSKFETRTTRSLAKMDGEYKSRFKSMGQSALSLTKGLAAGIAGGFIGGLVGAGIEGMIGQFREVARSVAEIGDQAKLAGIDVKAFQELRYVADQNRIGVDALADGIKELNLRADEFILSGGKSGSAAEAFQRLGFSATDLKEKLKDPSALFSEIIGKLQQFDKAAQIRISDELFGGSAGERFVQLIEQGEAGIRATVQEARDLGLVMDSELIERAAEIDRRFNAIANTVGTALKSAIVSAADSLAEFIDGFRAFENQRSRTLENRQLEIANQRLDLENQILDLTDKQSKSASELSDVAKDLGFANGRNTSLDGYTSQIDEARKKLTALGEEDAKITGVLFNRISPMQRTGDRTWTPPAYTPPSSGGGGSSRSASVSATDREREAVTKLIAELEEELRLVGATDAQRRAAIALRQAGSAATEEERQKIIALNEAIYQEEEARQRASDALDFQKSALSGLITDLRNGASVGEAFANVLSKIADRIQDELVDAIFSVNSAGGGGTGFFGTIFGGIGKILGFADGGCTEGIFVAGNMEIL